MKLNGETPGVFEEPVILPRGNGDLEFVAQAIMDWEEFNMLCPRPSPKEFQKILPDGRKVPNPKDPRYIDALTQYARRQTQYLIIKSLSLGTKGLEWEKVDLADASTWEHVYKELSDSGLSFNEIDRLVRAVEKANCLSEDALEQARQSFFVRRELRNGLSDDSPEDEPKNTQSGEPANESE